MKLNQFMWSANRVRLEASKTENERDLPLWNPIRDVVRSRISEGLTDGEYIFPRARKESFDKMTDDAVLTAATRADLDYGQEHGFTIHSLRHTFITDMMDAMNKDVALVMSWSGHRSLESFKIYLHATEQGRMLGSLHIDRVAEFLRTFTRRPGTRDQRERMPRELMPSNDNNL